MRKEQLRCPEGIHRLLYGIVGLALSVVLLVSPVAVASEIACDGYTDPRTRQAVKFVHEAADLVQAKGKLAFKELSIKGGRWFKGDMYIFVHGMDGKLLVNGAFPGMVGSNMIDFRDVAGKYIVRQMIDEVRRYGRDNGWVHYLWPPPGEVEPAWKSSFVHFAKGPDGQGYIVGTGMYDIPMERCFAMEQVDEAAMLIEKRGERAFHEISARTGPFLWKESYVFVLGMDGVELVNGVFPELVGTNVMDLKDAKGTAMVREMFQVAKAGGGWVEYLWPKPGYVADSIKYTYVKLVRSGGKQYIVACGIYLD